MNSEQTPFSTERPITLKLIPNDSGPRSITVAFPSDEQWSRRNRSQKVMIKDLGRNTTDTKVLRNERVDIEIVQEIKRDETEIDGAEASYVLNQLSLAQIDGADREGSGYRIFLQVPGIVTEHVMRMPTQREVQEYDDSYARLIGHPFGQRELRTNLSVAAHLYSQLRIETEGYLEKSLVPIIHQDAIVKAVLSTLKQEMALEAIEPEDF